MQQKLQPVLLGGVVIGVLSALPIINIGNCCCLWVLSGGALAAYLLQQNQVAPIASGDGAIVGLLAGIFGAVVRTVLSIPILLLLGPMQGRFMQRMMENAGELPPEVRPYLDSFGATALSFVGIIVGFFFWLVVGAIFGALGGLLGATFFRKDAPPMPPPGGPGPGGFSPPFNPPPFNPPPLPPSN